MRIYRTAFLGLALLLGACFQNERAQPGFELTVAPADLALPSGASGIVVVELERPPGLAGAVTVSATGAPPGLEMEPLAIPASRRRGRLRFAADRDLRPGRYELTLVAAAGRSRRSAPLTVRVGGERGGGDARLPPAAIVHTFVVNSLSDASDPNVDGPGPDDGRCDVDLATPGDQCGWRAMIENHNARRTIGPGDSNKATFDLPRELAQDGVFVFRPATPYPPVLGSLRIVAVEQPGYGDTPPPRVDVRFGGEPFAPHPDPPPRPLIVLDGSDLVDVGGAGVEFLGSGSILWGVEVRGFPGHGVFLGGTPFGGGGHQILGSYLHRNGGDGIHNDDTPNNAIGGPGPGEPNVIVGNDGYGLLVRGRDPDDSGNPLSGAFGQLVRGTTVGLDPLASGGADPEAWSVVPNGLGAMRFEDATDSTVGGDGDGEGNRLEGRRSGIEFIAGIPFVDEDFGLGIRGNVVGRDGSGVGFRTGILLRGGTLFTLDGNVMLRSIEDVAIDLDLETGGTYNVLDQRFEADFEGGVRVTAAEVVDARLTLEGNVHTGGASPLEFEELSLATEVALRVGGTSFELNREPVRLTLRGGGTTDLLDNTWTGSLRGSLQFDGEIAPTVFHRVRVEGGGFDRSGLDAIGVDLDVQGAVLFDLLGLRVADSDGHAVFFAARVAAGARFEATMTGLETTFSARAGIGVDVDREFSGVVGIVYERSSSVGDFVGIEVFGLRLGERAEDARALGGAAGLEPADAELRIVDATITGATEAALRLGGDLTVAVEGGTLAGSGVGVHARENARALVQGAVLAGNGSGALVEDAAQLQLSRSPVAASAGLGIDLGFDGVTPNDPDDADAGPNGLQNFPLLAAFVPGTTGAVLAGSLDSAPDAGYILEFFGNGGCDPSGFGEGEVFLGAVTVRTDSAGRAGFRAELPLPGSEPAFATATATDANGNTSEFSACLAADTSGPPPPPAPTRDVAIDIRPGSRGNPVALGSRGFLPVALFSGSDFDATGTVAASLRFGDVDRDARAGPVRVRRRHLDRDGRCDLLVWFRIRDLAGSGALVADSRAAELTGATESGEAFRGADRVRIVGRGGPAGDDAANELPDDPGGAGAGDPQGGRPRRPSCG